MPEDHVFAVLDGDDIAQAAGGQHLVQLGEEGRVAQHVADLHQPAGALGRLDQRNGVGQAVGHGLLQQHIVAGLERRQRRGHVQLVLGHIETCVGQLSGGHQLLPGLEAALGWDAVGGGETLPAGLVWLGDGDKAQLVGVL
jgi:hypothetical protein